MLNIHTFGILGVVCAATFLMACQSTKHLSGQSPSPCAKDGYRQSLLTHHCVQPSIETHIAFMNADGEMVYVLLSDDRQFAEVFIGNSPQSIVLEAVKGGYLSADGKTRLINTGQAWRLLRP